MTALTLTLSESQKQTILAMSTDRQMALGSWCSAIGAEVSHNDEDNKIKMQFKQEIDGTEFIMRLIMATSDNTIVFEPTSESGLLLRRLITTKDSLADVVFSTATMPDEYRGRRFFTFISPASATMFKLRWM